MICFGVLIDMLSISFPGPDKDDDRVKVRVTRVNRKDLPKTEEKGSDLDSVENQLKDELEKAGLDLAGINYYCILIFIFILMFQIERDKVLNYNEGL